MEPVLVGVGLPDAAGHIQDQVEQLSAHLRDGLLPGGDGAGVHVDEVEPVGLHLVAGADLDHRGGGQAVGGTPAGHEDLEADAAGQLRGSADDVAGGGGGVDQAVLMGLLRGGEHLLDRGGARLGDGAHGLLHDVGQAALLVAGCGVGVPAHAAGLQIVVVPLHLGGQLVPGGRVPAPGGQQMDAVPHLGDLAEQHRGATLHQHVGGVAGAGVGGEAGEGVAAAALHADEQLAEGQLLPMAQVEPLELLLRHGH